VRLFKASGRGERNHGWLKTNHSFSFADFYEPSLLSFGALLVLNDDTVAPGRGFGMHPHKNMEIITIPMTGALRHEDSLGNSATVKAGEVQLMSAGTGVVHSEMNASETEPVHLFQIWIVPNMQNVPPRYEQKAFTLIPNALTSVISPTGENDTFRIYQNAYLALGSYEKPASETYKTHSEANGVYLFVIEGEVTMSGYELEARDAVGISEAGEVSFMTNGPTKVLFIEVPLVS